MEGYLLPVFLILTGLSQIGAPIPYPLMIVSGICGLLAGVLMLI